MPASTHLDRRIVGPLGLLLTLAAGCGEVDPLPPSADAGPPPAAVRPPRVDAFRARTASVAPGQGAELEWSVFDARGVQIRSDGLSWRHDGPATGTVTTPPFEAPQRFVLTAEGQGGVAVAEIEVGLELPPQAAAIESFEVFPERFEGAGADLRLSWRATGRLRLEIDGEPQADFPGNEATFWALYVREPTLFTLIAESEDERVERSVQVRRSGRELEPNDERGSAGFLDRDGRASGQIEPAGDVDWFVLEVPAGSHLWAEVTDGDGGCALDSQLELWGPDPERPGQIRFLTLSDDADGRLCAVIDPAVDAAALELEAGRHYLSVRGFDARARGPYALNVRVGAAECGNGLVEPSRGETCDAPQRQCQDCQLLFDGAAPIRGPDISERRALPLSPGEERFVEVVVEAEAVVGAELRDGDGRCRSGLELSLMDPARSGGRTALVLDDGLRSPCGELRTVSRSPGRYVLRARSASAVEGAYVDVRVANPGCGDGILSTRGGEQCDDGNLQAGDGCSSDCTWAPVATATSIAPLTIPDRNLRFIAVDVEQPGSSVTASVAGAGADHVVLSLHDAGFLLLGEAPRGLPLGGPGVGTSFATDLPAGRHYVGLRRTRVDGGLLTVAVGTRAPRCADGLVQTRVGESCDDGFRVSGDGCDDQCRLELGAPLIEIPGAGFPQVAGVVPSTGALHFGIRTSTVVRLSSVGTGHPQIFRCDPPADTDLRLTLLDGQLREILVADGATGCPQISQEHIGPGDWYLRLEVIGGRSIDPVQLRVFAGPGRCGDGGLDDNEACDDANLTGGDGCSSVCRWEAGADTEHEPNDDAETAEALPARVGGAVVKRLGAVHTFDRDLYRIDIGRWQEVALDARTAEPQTSFFCRPDTMLRLLDARGQVIAENDDDPERNGGCSRLDLTGARRLLEGTYYLEVTAGPMARRVPLYVLEVTLR